ncbi:hypothetical protein GJ496_010797 [Pomphorhynchus laevis]|nr:hypothetical protein GJ496_010797 [Pomphorhynchus laevis]
METDNGLPVNHANDNNLDREVGAPSIDDMNYMSTHAQSSTDISQSQEEEPVNDQPDVKDPMMTTNAGDDLNTSNESLVFDFLPHRSRSGRIIIRSKSFNY